MEDLLALPMLAPDRVTDPLNAYQLAKRGNVLRVMAQAVAWGRRGGRVNAISPGIIITPLARDELIGPRGEGYRAMLSGSPAGRAGTPDEGRHPSITRRCPDAGSGRVRGALTRLTTTQSDRRLDGSPPSSTARSRTAYR